MEISHFVENLTKNVTFAQNAQFSLNFSIISGSKEIFVKYEYSFQALESQPQNKYSTSL